MRQRRRRKCVPHDTLDIGFLLDPMYLRHLSSHWRGPFKDISTQQGVLVTS